MVKPTTPVPGTGNRPADKVRVTLKTPTPQGKATGFYSDRFVRPDNPALLCVVLDGPVPEVAWVSGDDLQ